MPFICAKTNKSVTELEEKQLKEALGEAISLIPGKSENWLMLEIQENCKLYFKGSNEKDLAFISVQLFGKASAESYSRLTERICSVCKSILGISEDCVYVKYEEVEYWGWNGSNF